MTFTVPGTVGGGGAHALTKNMHCVFVMIISNHRQFITSSVWVFYVTPPVLRNAVNFIHFVVWK